MKIGVAVITRNRPKSLHRLLTSYVQLVPPEHASLHFIVVENNDALTMGGVVEKFRQALKGSANETASISVDIEQTQGIPFARNKALDMAIELDCDFMSFTDDDCEVSPDWLVDLIKTQKESGADLVTGAVQPIPESSPKSNQFVRNGLIRYFDRHRQKEDLPGTNNWLGRLEFIKAKSLRFDESYGLSSGSDWKFKKDLIAAGGYTDFTRNVRVHELVPVDRTTIRSLFERSRDFKKANKKIYQASPFYLVASIASRILFHVIPRLVLSPFDRGYSFVMAIKQAGKVAGQIDVLFGRRRSFYRTTTGE